MWVVSLKVTLLQVMVMLLLMVFVFYTIPESKSFNNDIIPVRSLSSDAGVVAVEHHHTINATTAEKELEAIAKDLKEGHPLNATMVEHELAAIEEALKEAEHEILVKEEALIKVEKELVVLEKELATVEKELIHTEETLKEVEQELADEPAKQEAKLLAAASHVFGIVATIESKYGTMTFIGFLIFLVCLEHGFENLEHLAIDNGVSLLFEKLKKELMMMGIISFVVFIFVTAGGAANHTLYSSFEMTHVIVLFMALAFICQAFFIVSYASTAGKRYLNALRTSSMKLLRMYKKCRFDPKQWWYFHHGSSMLPAHPSFRTDIEFRIIERLFTFQHKLSADFNFANYVNMLFMQYTAELSEVTPVGWFMLACLVAINYMRIALLDPILKRKRCSVMSPSIYGYQSLDAISEEHRTLSGVGSNWEAIRRLGGGGGGGAAVSADKYDDVTYLGTPACNTYLIGYNFCCASLLVILAISVYVLSTIYIDRVIRRSLELDKIDKHPDGIRYAYKDSLDIMVRREKMLAHAELLRKKRLKLGIIEQEFTASKPKKHDVMGALGGNHNASHTSDQLGDKIGSFLHQSDNTQFATIHGSAKLSGGAEETPIQSPVRKHKKSIGDAFSGLWGTVTGTKASMVVVTTDSPTHHEEGEHGEEHKKAEEMEAGMATTATKHKKLKMEKNLDSIFLFGSPALFFRSVEALLLFQCFYISMTATQFIPIATKVNANVGGFVIGFIVPILVVFYIIQLSLNKTVLLRAVFELDREVAGKVVEEAKEEKVAIIKMKDAVFKHLAEEEVPDDEVQNYLKEYFFRYDTKETGEVGEKDFKRVLGDLGVYLSRDGFRILWTAVDFDLSGALSWDEITDILFEADDEDEEPELEAVIELRQSLQEMLASQEVPITELEAYLEGVFKSFDEDGSGDMEEDEFAGLLHTLGIKVEADKISDVFSAIDTEHSNGISFDEFFAVVFRKHKAMIAASNNADDDAD